MVHYKRGFKDQSETFSRANKTHHPTAIVARKGKKKDRRSISMACKQTLRTFDGICGRECVYNKCLAGKKVAVCWNTTASTGCCLNWQVAREFDSNEKLQIIRTFALKTGRKGIHAPFGPVQHNLVVTMCV